MAEDFYIIPIAVDCRPDHRRKCPRGRCARGNVQRRLSSVGLTTPVTGPSYESTRVQRTWRNGGGRDDSEFWLQFARAAVNRPNLAPALATAKIPLGDVHALA